MEALTAITGDGVVVAIKDWVLEDWALVVIGDAILAIVVIGDAVVIGNAVLVVIGDAAFVAMRDIAVVGAGAGLTKSIRSLLGIRVL